MWNHKIASATVIKKNKAGSIISLIPISITKLYQQNSGMDWKKPAPRSVKWNKRPEISPHTFYGLLIYYKGAKNIMQ